VKLIVAQLVENFPPFMESEGPLTLCYISASCCGSVINLTG
jgi:hypothetical protein